ncbi:MAG: hypothetical protein H6Q17_2025 [Bacteroidetes bacterium]|nr:hypothetical protein [Bacteroidota bacterium]
MLFCMNTSHILQWLKKHGDSLIASVAGFFIIYFFTKHGGIGISPDSIAYTSTARNFVAGNGLMIFGGHPLVDFPVCYPLFLSLVMLITKLDVVTCAPVLNGLMFAVVILLSGVIMERFIRRSKWYKTILLIAIATSPSLIEIYSMLWSETLFIILSLLFFFSLHRYYRNHSLRTLLVPAILAAIAFDTRYAGITLVATGEILLFWDKQLKWKEKIKHLVLFGIIGCSLVTINLVHNAVATGLLTGKRQKGITPLSDNIAYSGSVLSDWTSLWGDNHYFFIIVGLLIIALFVWLFIKNLKKKQDYHSYENIVIAFFIVYVSFIVLSSTISRYEQINNRLLSAAFLPFLWGVTHKVPAWIRALRDRRHKWGVGIIFTAIAIGVCANYYAINTDNYSFMQESGIPGYTEDCWRESPTIRFIQRNRIYFDPDSMVYSNHNQAVYFYTNYAVDAVPEKAYKGDVKMFADESPIVLIWFYSDPNPELLSLKDIRKMKKLKVLHSFDDGAIFLCLNRDTTSTGPPKLKTSFTHFK